MLITMAVSLYTSRVVLQALGVEDFGIYNVVGGVVVLITFLNNSLTGATQRFLSIGLGTAHICNLSKIFNTCIFVHKILAIVILLFSQFIGLWFIDNKLQIPTNRAVAAFWVFQASVCSMVVMILSVPYNALIIAYEQMRAFAYVSIIEVFFKLLVALSLKIIIFDKLIYYAVLIVFAQIVVRMIYQWYCHKKYSDIVSESKYDKKTMVEILKFASWTIIGNLANILSSQGLNILLNIFFGPIVNASRGLAVQIQSALQSFVSNFQTSINPQIFKTFAAQQIDYHRKLVISSARFSMLLMGFLSIPFIFEAEIILDLWLGNVPAYAANFLRLTLVIVTLDASVNAPDMSINATGKIRTYQLTTCGIMLLTVPISYLFLVNGCKPYVVYYIHFAVIVFSQMMRLLLDARYTGLSLKDFFLKVYLKNLISICLMSIIPYIIFISVQQGILRLMLTMIFSYLGGLLIIFFVSFNSNERQLVLDFLKRKLMGGINKKKA
ncbi:hypothetical protein B7982_10640 [Fibrobacter sp. UWB2]|nr:hypothetical protein B7982_10640 [Fibrobacter sp. UWB2]